MFVLGIVGSIAGGKSTAAGYLQQKNAAWINADEIARASLDLQSVQSKLVRRFGHSIVGIDGDVDRRELGAIVFGQDAASEANLRYLESAVHPVVRKQIRQQLSQNIDDEVQVSLLDVPLLFESGWDLFCDQVWCIDASPEIRAQRAAARGWDSDEISKRELRQKPMSEKIRLSNLVILNNGTIDELHQSLDHHWQRLIESLINIPPNDHPDS
jgi:dephospho-CoA kinase